MIFYFSGSGTPLSMIPERVFQGSNKASSIYFICPTAQVNLVNAAFTLPNGVNTAPHLMTLSTEQGLEGVFDGEGNVFNVWTYEMTSAITALPGTVCVQFTITSQGGEVVATPSVQFFVERGVEVEEPQQGDSYGEVMGVIVTNSARISELEDLSETHATISYADGKVAKTLSANKIYATDGDGNQTTVGVSNEPTEGNVPLYCANGRLNVGTPTEDLNAATKLYVDDNFGYSLAILNDNENYVITINLINKNGDIISSQSVDLPLESVVVGGTYDSVNRKLVLTLSGGGTVDVFVGDLVSGLLSSKSNDGSKTELYAFSGTAQTSKEISSAPVADKIPIYGIGGKLKTAAPTDGNDAVNKDYLTENFSLNTVVNNTDSSVTLQVSPSSQYFYGTLSALNLSFASGTNYGELFYLTFKSGTTATAINVGGTNFVSETAITSATNVTVEISGIWNGEKWLIAWRQL